MLLASVFAIIIGFLLGLLGGGGSILTVPVLVYLADISAKSAIVTSLIVVGCTSLIATYQHARKGYVCWKTGAIFGIAGMFGAFLGGRLTAYIPGALLLVLLGIIMLIAAFSMILKDSKQSDDTSSCSSETPICPLELPVLAILFDGFFLGIVTGLVGVGGGFLLVPALAHLAKLSIHGAIGTSLFIITLQSTAALAGHANHLDIDPAITFTITCLAIIGSFAGASASNHIPAHYLKRGFGYFVLLLGSYLIYKEVNQTIVLQVQTLIKDNREFIIGASSVIAFMLIYRLWAWLHTRSNKI
ncbi:MAG: sulfite exporter TauE/SafE family protein [Methyloprofundus sp.]|nr:sulfite exporter TauE/SafE family protein [Methyloprofundus sp.]MDT8425407.1 sulfite exporter TauE/SafE family protein [Methyloprofundus sp.]